MKLDRSSSRDSSSALVVFKRVPRFEYDTGSDVPDPYAVLQVDRQATLAEIKSAYKELAYTYHPDRVTRKTRLFLNGKDPSVVFTEINAAYTVLVDEYKRTRFHAMETMNEEDIEKLGAIKQRHAQLEVELMKETILCSAQAERASGGMVIVRALYGEMPETVDINRPLAEQSFGEVIDVTKPVQYLVEDSHVIIPGGNSKVLLKGFYDPVNGYPKVLAIRYLFQNRLHQLVVQDFDAIRMPMKRHLLPHTSEDLVLADIQATLKKPNPLSQRRRRSTLYGNTERDEASEAVASMQPAREVVAARKARSADSEELCVWYPPVSKRYVVSYVLVAMGLYAVGSSKFMKRAVASLRGSSKPARR